MRKERLVTIPRGPLAPMPYAVQIVGVDLFRAMKEAPSPHDGSPLEHATNAIFYSGARLFR